MKILLISTTYPTPTRPRQGAFNRVLVDALRVKHDVQVLAPIPWTQLHARRTETPAEKVDHPIYFFTPKLMRQHHGLLYWHSIRRAVQSLGQRFIPDVVLGYWLHPDGFAATMAARYFNVASVVMSGGTDLRLLPQSRARRAKIQQVLRQADRLVVVSGELAERAKALGTVASKIDVVYRGVDRNFFQPTVKSAARRKCGVSESAIVILWVGRFELVKNPTLLLEATRLWKQKWGERVRVVMIGDGSLQGELNRLAQRLGLQDSLQLLPPMPQKRLADYYNAADLTVLTSHSEGIPNVLLESISCGKRFVSTDVGGIQEIACQGLDFLVPPGNMQAFAEAVIGSVQQDSVEKRRFKPYDSREMADELEKSLARAVASHRQSDARAADAA